MTLVSDAAKELNAATSYHMVVSYQEGTQVDVTADLHFLLPGDAVGTVTENGNTVNVLETGGTMYLQGKDFISESGGSAHGTAELDSTRGKMYIAELPPHRLVKIESTDGFVAADGLTNVNFELLEYGDAVDVKVPADFADPNNPETLAPQYALSGRANVPPCSYYSCAMTGKVVNNGGAYPPIAASTFTFTVYTSPAQKVIDHCSGRIPTLKHGATTSIACAIASQAWRSYTGSSFYWDVTIDNPNYDG